MALIGVSDLKKMFAGETLFENVSFNVYESDKIGFIGVNGAGKSTLFKIIVGQIEHDGGEIFKSKDIKIGYLEQYVIPDGNRSIMDEMLTVFSEVIEIEKELEKICMDIENNNGDINALISKQAFLQERYLTLGGTYYISQIKSVLMGLGFTESDFSIPLSKLSGGQKTRIALCKILLTDANLLLLDEPTNHLDIDSIEWLEDFLMNYKGAFIVISHDRYFLDKVTKKTFELENKHFKTYNVNYSAYVVQREIERLTEQRNYDYSIGEIHRLEEVVEQQRRWKHKKNKKTHTLDNTRKAIERLENNLVVPEKNPDSINFKFKACSGGGKIVLSVENLGMKFGENKLFENVNMELKKGEKVFLLGPNGCGKTTLIKILTGIYEQSFGKYKVGENIKIGYYDQLKENLNREKTVIDEIWDEYPRLAQTEIRSALALFLFCGEDVFKKISSLSGGELARVELAKLLLKNVNFLIMDEPTNHLDVASREALEAALSDYDGAMLMVSHDRYFINKLADRILYLTPNGLTEYEGDYDDFIANRQKNTIAKTAEIKIENKNNDYKEKKKIEARKRKNINNLAKIEGIIEQVENEIEVLSQKLDSPDVMSDYVKICEINDKIEEFRKDLNKHMEEWEILQYIVDET